jgi:hypothetical protein
VETPPGWIADAQQYFARVRADGVAVELSTVEIESESDTMECVGVGPWLHFDVVNCGAGRISAVATELRLITEVIRSREDRYRPIVGYLRRHGCDIGLIRRGLADLGAKQDRVDRILAELSPTTRP